MAGAREDALIGRVFANRYRLDEQIGDGAMGVVYRARHVKIARAFAVKVLHPQLLAKDKVRRRFEREAELAASLRHDNVIGVVDVGETEDGLKYLVMDFAEGETLATLIVKGAMPASRVVRIVRQLCDGLAHAHEAGLIHRDFKPDNVIVQRDGNGRETPRIVDFGIALLRDDAPASERERLTTAGIVLGTPHYMAPEHASGQPIDHRIDLFALGVICFEMMTGRLPFDGDGVDVARANMSFDPPSMRELVPNLEPDPLLEAFTRKLMARSLDDRFATARAAREMLDLIDRDRNAATIALDLAPPPIVAPPPPRLMQAMQIVRTRAVDSIPPGTTSTVIDPEMQRDTLQVRPLRARHNDKSIAIAATIAVLLIGGGLFALRSNGKPERTQPVANVVQAPATAVRAAQPIATPTPPAPVALEMVPAPAPIKVTPPPPRPVAKIAPRAPSQLPPTAHRLPPTTTPAPDLTPSAAELAQYYASIGRKLGMLEKTHGQPATLELWPRYRRIRIQALLSKPDDRRAGTTELRAVERAIDAAARAPH